MTDAELQSIADEVGESIEIVRDLHEAMQVCGAEGADEAKADRAQRAREAFWDSATPSGTRENVEVLGVAADSAIEAATRVRVDSDITQAVRDAHPDIMIKTTELKGMIETAFRAAGFEVEQ